MVAIGDEKHAQGGHGIPLPIGASRLGHNQSESRIRGDRRGQVTIDGAIFFPGGDQVSPGTGVESRMIQGATAVVWEEVPGISGGFRDALNPGENLDGWAAVLSVHRRLVSILTQGTRTRPAINS
jgi:hypothetical protein